MKLGKNNPQLHSFFNNIGNIHLVSCIKILGLFIDQSLTWSFHIDEIIKKISQRVFILRVLKHYGISYYILISVYKALIYSVADYASSSFINLNAINNHKLEMIRNRCHKIICGVICAHPDCFLSLRISNLRLNNSIRLFNNIQENNVSLLHHCIPKKLKFTNQFVSELRRTKWRCDSFFVFIPTAINHHKFQS
jgi:hypothetical protein